MIVLPYRLAGLWLSALTVILIPQLSQGQVYANFDGGNSTGVVDGFTGMAGEGWLGSWMHRSNSSGFSSNRTVTSANPLTGSSGNYFFIDAQTTGGGGTVVGRRYSSHGSLSINELHTVHLLLRHEGTSSDLRELVVYDGFGETAGQMALSVPSSSQLTWGVRSQGSSWQVYDNGWVNSTLSLVSGDTYALTVVVDPAANRYRAKIVNLDWDGASGGGVYESDDWLSFGVKDGAVGGTLTFLHRLGGGAEDVPSIGQLSIDSIAIIPESGHLAAVLGAFAVGALLLSSRLSGRKVRLGTKSSR